MLRALDRQFGLPLLWIRRGRPGSQHKVPLFAFALSGLFAMGCMEPEPQYLPPLPDLAAANQTQGVPCAVAKLISDKCVVCHGQPPAAAPISLVGYESLTAVSTADPQKKVIERAILRMQDSSSPMPPGPAVTVSPSELLPLQTWVAAGTPMTQCQSK